MTPALRRRAQAAERARRHRAGRKRGTAVYSIRVQERQLLDALRDGSDPPRCPVSVAPELEGKGCPHQADERDARTRRSQPIRQVAGIGRSGAKGPHNGRTPAAPIPRCAAKHAARAQQLSVQICSMLLGFMLQGRSYGI